MATQSNAFSNNVPRKIITADGDVNVGNLDTQVHLFSSTEPPTPGEQHAVLLPCNPQLGETHLILGATAGAILDGNGSPIVRPGVVNPNVLAAGDCVQLVFTKDPAGKDCGCGSSDNGGFWHAC